MIDVDEREPTEQELEEARALADALEGGDAAGPADALAAAELLERGRDPARDVAAVRARVLADTRAMLRRRRAMRAARVLAPLLAAAALVLVAVRAPHPREPRPTPSIALLEAQLRAASGARDDRLAREMRAYRRELHRALLDRYGR